MRPVFRNAFLALAVLIFAAFVIFPPEKNLRLGKDLRGGVSLVYAVQLEAGDNAGEVLGQTIDVLKRRVDPNGVLEIAMVAQGRDRIEITMPLPGEDVKRLKAAFESKLLELGQASIEPAELERVLRLEGADRADALDQLAGGSDQRRTLLENLADLSDRGRELRARLASAQEAGLTPEQIDDIINEAADVELEYDELREEALASALSPETVRRALELDDDPKRVFDRDTEETIELPSARRRALDAILERFPDIGPKLDEVIASWETYNAERRTLDDPADLKRLLRGAGVLTFRISVNVGELPEEESLRRELQEVGPKLAGGDSAKWYKINNIDPFYSDAAELQAINDNAAGFLAGRGYVVEEYNGEYWMLLWDERGLRLTPAEGDRWQVSRAFQTVDDVGRPAIGFNMNTVGGQLLGELSEPNVGRQMAVLLDDQVYGAPPTLQSRIATNGRITGDFSQDEVRYVIRTLAAGSLQAKLSPEPIAEFQVAPDLGVDNLKSGLQAGLWALAAVSVFMVIYYFIYGGVSVFALCCNALLILGAMAANKSAFTLPGIAGIILTFGMAVDANVLIYERIREELRKGAELRIAVRLGFQRALSSIVDGNVTNLIVCLVLANFGTQEIKGFAITLGIGVVGTLFSSLVVSRVIFQLMVEVGGLKKMAMLPMAVPPLERLLEPKIKWLSFRPLFIVISLIYVSVGVGMVVWQGEKMLDNEFRGGTQITVQLERDEATGERRTEERAIIEDLVHATADAEGADERLLELRNAEVVAVDPGAGGTTSDRFTIKTTLTDQSLVEDAVLGALSEYIESLPPISFFGRDVESVRNAPAYRVISGRLGDDTDRPRFRDDVSEFRGGLAIMLEQMDPKPSIESIEERIETLRSQPDYAAGSGRRVEVRLLEGDADAVDTAVILVLDPSLSFYDDDELWQSTVLAQEWSLARESLGRATAPAQLQRFSPVIAENFRAQAIVAVGLSFLLITIYIWVRFGSVRYSLAALITLLHDVMVAIGLIALAEIVYDFPATADIARSIGVLPFKINLTLVAALLTIIGYSLNDTIIIMDRIRENRGKLPYATRDVVNLSINQTISRTVITSGTTLVATLILYIFGGEGVRAFSYALLIGVVVGTYSSIAVAAPLVWTRKNPGDQGRSKA